VTKRYLRQTRAEMARLERLNIATRGNVSFCLRCWADRDEKVRAAVLDGLVRVELKAHVPVYALLSDPGDDRSPTEVWRVHNRAYLGVVSLERVIDLIYADVWAAA
jgi:hypothetical protein